MSALGRGFDDYGRHVNPALARFLALSGRDVRFVRAAGATLEDDRGERWDDWIAGFGALALGHDHPEVRRAAQEHLERGAPNLYPEALNPWAGALAGELVRRFGPGYATCYLASSGSEAVEAALKTALLATGRPRIAYAAGGFHGTTLGALGCMGRGLYRDPFAAALPPWREVAWGDLEALEAALAPGDVAAFLLEPVQVEAGLRIASPEYLAGARDLCRRAGALLLVDEVQTGLGRTGALSLAAARGVVPDVLVLGKALGGGLVPVSAALMGEGIWERAFGSPLRADIHSSTFGGNALGCAVALRALALLGDPELHARVRATSDALFGALGDALGGSPLVARIGRVGLLGGIALREPPHPWFRWEHLGLPELEGLPVSGPLLLERLARRRILAHVCGHDWSVVRVEPPLTVDPAACQRFVAAVADAVRWLEQEGDAP